MVKRKLYLDDITGAASGKVATINCPVGYRYHFIMLVLGNTAAGDANAPTNTLASPFSTDIQVLLGGNLQRKCTSYELDCINSANGANYAQNSIAGTGNGSGRLYLPIYFAEPWRVAVADRDRLAWQTRGYSNFQIKVLLPAITPAVSAYAIVDDYSSGKQEGITKWYQDNFTVTGTKALITRLAMKDFYQQISLFKTVGTNNVVVSKVTLKSGGLTLHELTKTENDQLLDNWGMVPGANEYHLAFDHDDLLNSAMPTSVNGGTLPNFELLVEYPTETGTMNAIIQRFGVPD